MSEVEQWIEMVRQVVKLTPGSSLPYCDLSIQAVFSANKNEV